FPSSSSLGLHCIAITNIRIDFMVTIILQQFFFGSSGVLKISKALGAKGNKKIVTDKDLRNSMLNRYGFVDNDDDKRDHRPVAPKWEGKKLVRYRDNKVVSLKGERYTELKKEESDEMKKTYVNLKPGKQYRFHC
ncbi:unnamed protein product, partial [Meganyctiphanes norvegica]